MTITEKTLQVSLPSAEFESDCLLKAPQNDYNEIVSQQI